MIARIPPKNHQVYDPLAYWDNFLSKEDINTILSLPNWHDSTAAYVGGTAEPTIDLKTRSSEVNWWLPCEKTAYIWDKITETIALVNNQHFHFDLTGCYEPAQLSIYKSTSRGHYDWHIDWMPDPTKTPRKLSMTILLSDPDDFKGGELQAKTFSDEIVTAEQVQGRAYFFPSWGLHRVTPVTKGVRRSLVMWIGGPPFK